MTPLRFCTKCWKCLDYGFVRTGNSAATTDACPGCTRRCEKIYQRVRKLRGAGLVPPAIDTKADFQQEKAA